MSATAAVATDLVEVRDVTKVYGDGATAVTALDHVSLTLHPGELVVLLGPSGSGKTTLLNLMGAIEEPTSGQVHVAGIDVTSLDVAERAAFRREHVGFVFQFFNLIPTLTAAENVGLVSELTGHVGMDPVEALRRVGLEREVDRFPAGLSGGQQQRVAIARALAKGSPLLLCDEPTGALDHETGAVVVEQLRLAVDRHGRAVVIVTHDQELARVADRVIRLRDGRVEADGNGGNGRAGGAVA